jgi:hypothetical protein
MSSNPLTELVEVLAGIEPVENSSELQYGGAVGIPATIVLEEMAALARAPEQDGAGPPLTRGIEHGVVRVEVIPRRRPYVAWVLWCSGTTIEPITAGCP